VVKPVDRYYRVKFPDPDALRAWRGRVLEYAATADGLAGGTPESRPVLFVPLLPEGRRSVYAYVSEAARPLVRELAEAAQIEAAPVTLRELPDGLTLLYGDGVDAEAYTNRRRSKPEA
jgi:hypothetical protein